MVISLREFAPEDQHRLVQFLNNIEVTRYLTSRISSPYTLREAHCWINEGSKSDSDIIRAITYRNEFVGCISINRGEFEHSRTGELGYWIGQEYWRKGIALNAIQQITDLAFKHTDIVRIYASVFSGNQPSMQLLRKAGYQQEAVLKSAMYKNDQFFDNHIFTKLKSS